MLIISVHWSGFYVAFTKKLIYVEENGSLVLSSSQDKLQCVFVVVRGDVSPDTDVFLNSSVALWQRDIKIVS